MHTAHTAQQGIPTLILVSRCHNPGSLDGTRFTRYLIYLLEQARIESDVGITKQMNFLVDRVGSGIQNQDPNLLSAMLPVRVLPR
jgi:hypothetical protein